ncbi:MAG TPA: response regulator [Steroidobacteraceae bacterium]
MRIDVIGVIEDDSLVRSAIEMLLISSGYRVELYASADEYSRAAPSSAADCALVDIQFAGVCGIDLMHLLRKGGLDLPVIFITGSDDSVYEQRAKEFGCAAFLRKPFTRIG